jgi:nitrous oxidase accessory protein
MAESLRCTISDNHIRSSTTAESHSGNGIHAWYCRDLVVANNDISGHRDGIYFEFVEDSIVEGNTSFLNLRYGLHFMFSDRCHYTDNTFRSNGAGVAVMYSEHILVERNRFAENRGSAAYGLLLKEIDDAELSGNAFVENSVGVYMEGSNRVKIQGNAFLKNGWALKVLANSEDTAFLDNDFAGNTFDVATNSRRTVSTFAGNYWDEYEGYDLDNDGVGDIPFRPVSLFSLMVEQNESSVVLLGSLFVDLLDLTERLVPTITPENLVDASPSIRPRTSMRARQEVERR